MSVGEQFGGVVADGALNVPARASPVEPAAPRGGFQPRRTYLKPKYFEKYDFTGGCPGCIAVQSGLGFKANHSDACRTRVEALMAEDAIDRVRVNRAQDRMEHFATKDAEQSSDGDASKPTGAADTAPPDTAIDVKIPELDSEDADVTFGDEIDVQCEDLHDVQTMRTEAREVPRESPRKAAKKRSAERYEINTPDPPKTKAREGLDDMPLQPTEPRTQDDVIGPRNPGTKRNAETNS